MLNPFLTFHLVLLAYAVLRVMLGGTLTVLGYRHLTSQRGEMAIAIRKYVSWFPQSIPFLTMYVGVAEMIIGSMFVVGWNTQIAALLGIVFSVKVLLFRKNFHYPLMPSSAFFVLMLAVSVSLFITGAGAFAMDIPL
jgi:uncharacterized membrane protein YphA (DoxX/SURF4 family)